MNTAGAECGISAPIHERLGLERHRIERCDLLVIMAGIHSEVFGDYIPAIDSISRSNPQ
jgi:hypothetical protein